MYTKKSHLPPASQSYTAFSRHKKNQLTNCRGYEMRKKRKQAGTYTPTNDHKKATKMQREEGWPLFVSKNTQTHTKKKKGLVGKFDAM
jgi:hypothetical protein